jgi:putative oxidoreductase
MNTFSASTVHNPVSPTATNQPRTSAASALQNVAELGGRVLLSALFLISGVGKIGAYAGTAAYMSALGVPAALLPVVIATEVLGAIALIVGWKTRVTAFLLAGFTLLTGLVFHTHFADQIQAIMFFKNVAIAGGLLLLVTHGAGTLSLDRRFTKSTDRGS